MLLPWPWYPPAVRLSNRSADGYPANPPALPPNPTAMRLLGHTTGRHPTRPSTGPAAISPYATGESHRRQIPARGTWLEPCTHMKPTLTPLPIRIRLQSPFPNPAFPRHHRVGRRLPIWRLMPFISLMSFISLIFHHHRHLFVSEPRHWQIHHQCIRCCSSAPTASLRRMSNGERRASAADNNRESTGNRQRFNHRYCTITPDAARSANSDVSRHRNRTGPCHTTHSADSFDGTHHHTRHVKAPFLISGLLAGFKRPPNHASPRLHHRSHPPAANARPPIQQRLISGDNQPVTRGRTEKKTVLPQTQ